MANSIPQMDQKILNKYYPGQAVENVLRTPTKSLRGYVITGDRGLLITTNKFKSILVSFATQIALQTKWNTSLNKEGDHMVCLLYPL